MHELGLCQDMLEIISEKAQGVRVKRVIVEVGALAAVLPDALRFCFDLVAAQTVAEGATLEILQVPGKARCGRCGENVELHRPYGQCRCGNSELESISGDELRIKALELT